MRRTKEWWTRLSREERSELWWAEDFIRSSSGAGSSPYLPDDCGDCGCGQPTLGGGPCPYHSKRQEELIAKADGVEERRDG
ncbi:hypothetical protein LCGC14_2983710 [marine sediment metagenome]|uniref:Uncharacterized protein n=1 Tax=marine sediment metagenome TaxID=412755 RepID=A0A0F8X5V6_9ZZZZ